MLVTENKRYRLKYSKTQFPYLALCKALWGAKAKGVLMLSVFDYYCKKKKMVILGRAA